MTKAKTHLATCMRNTAAGKCDCAVLRKRMKRLKIRNPFDLL